MTTKKKTRKPKPQIEAGAYMHNAKVGDAVWYRAKPKGAFETDWTIYQTGLINPSGYPLNVRIRKAGTSKTKIVSPFLGVFILGEKDAVLILAPPEEIDASVMMSMIRDSYPGLVILRSPANSDYWRYEILCPTCMSMLRMESSERSTSEIIFHEHDEYVSAGKPSLEEYACELRCDCDNIPDYDIPFVDYDGGGHNIDSE